MPDEGFDIHTAALETEAGMWDRLSGMMSTMANNVDGLRLSEEITLMYFIYEDGYNRITDTIRDHCNEGSGRMTDVGERLRRVLELFEATEEVQRHKFDKLLMSMPDAQSRQR
jgi:hypothetical protein